MSTGFLTKKQVPLPHNRYTTVWPIRKATSIPQDGGSVRLLAAGVSVGKGGIPLDGGQAGDCSVVNIPLEWGILIIEGFTRNSRLSLAEMVLNRQPIKPVTVLFWTVLVFLSVLVAFALLSPPTGWTETALFSWVPRWFKQFVVGHSSILPGGFKTSFQCRHQQIS
ncbi:MAG TPA: hypothetical protein VLH85_05365 [Levilinea sp.]|nr:hypothetical protein [Levilinea sp.]